MIRQSGTIGLTVVGCCLVMLAAAWLTPSSAQQPPPPAQGLMQGNWRYQLYNWGTTNHIVLLDSQTGRCWTKSLATNWEDLKAPPGEKK
jgi:hypothetical protein